MNGLLEYVKSFVALFILIKILLQLIPKNVFARYIAFFSGLILAIGMLHPVLELFGVEEKILTGVQYESFEDEMEKISRDAEKLEESNLRRYEALLGEMKADE